MGRKTKLLCFKQETELCLHFFHTETKKIEHFLLCIALVHPDRTATKFNTIKHNIVCTRFDRTKVLLVPLTFWRGKWMMRRIPPFLFFVIFKQWKVSNPRKMKLIV